MSTASMLQLFENSLMTTGAFRHACVCVQAR